MNWDQQLIKACTETDGTPHPHTDHVLTGAKWQREQLRTNGAIERVSWSISLRRQCGDCDRGYSPDTCGECWGDAVTAIDALLGADA